MWLPDSRSSLTVSSLCTHIHSGVRESNSCTGAVVAAVIGGVAAFILGGGGVIAIIVVVVILWRKQKKGMKSKFQ